MIEKNASNRWFWFSSMLDFSRIEANNTSDNIVIILRNKVRDPLKIIQWREWLTLLKWSPTQSFCLLFIYLKPLYSLQAASQLILEPILPIFFLFQITGKRMVHRSHFIFIPCYQVIISLHDKILSQHLFSILMLITNLKTFYNFIMETSYATYS